MLPKINTIVARKPQVILSRRLRQAGVASEKPGESIESLARIVNPAQGGAQPPPLRWRKTGRRMVDIGRKVFAGDPQAERIAIKRQGIGVVTERDLSLLGDRRHTDGIEARRQRLRDRARKPWPSERRGQS